MRRSKQPLGWSIHFQTGRSKPRLQRGVNQLALPVARHGRRSLLLARCGCREAITARRPVEGVFCLPVKQFVEDRYKIVPFRPDGREDQLLCRYSFEISLNKKAVQIGRAAWNER